MTTVSTWTGGAGEDNCFALTFDGTYIYAGLEISPAIVIKIDPATMTTVSTWTGGAGEDNCLALTFDGTYIYAGLYTTPALVIKIDPATMTTVSTWTGGAGEDYCIALTFDGTYIYAGLQKTPALVIRFMLPRTTSFDFGVATIAALGSSIVVNHNLGVVPKQVHLTPRTNPGAALVFWVDTLTSTQFTINCSPATTNPLDFSWIAI